MLLSSKKGQTFTTATQSFSVYLRPNKEVGLSRSLLVVEKGKTLTKLRKDAGKLLGLKPKKGASIRLFLTSGHEVQFIDELKQDDEVFVSAGDDFFKFRSSSGKQAEEFEISVLGSGGVGKSALTLRFIKSLFISSWDPTIEDAYSKTVTVDGKVSKLNILDTAGQDDFESLRPHWIKDKDGYMFVFSLDQASSFTELAKFRKLVADIDSAGDKPIVVVGNKADLFEAANKQRPIDKGSVEVFSSSMSAQYTEASALSGVGVEAAFESLLRQLRKKKEARLKKPVLLKRHQFCVLA